jgi:L-2-hydroxyglutarate oxidase
MTQRNVVIIGAGIVGLSVAYELLLRHPKTILTVIEKESGSAYHQSGRNSGVIHSGIYYKPGSLKAINCRAGKSLMERFCQEHGIKFELCGKVIVATDQHELNTLEMIYQRGLANGVSCEIISEQRLREIEPHCAGIKAIYVPEAGIVHYPDVCKKLVELIRARGGQVNFNERIEQAHQIGARMTLQSNTSSYSPDLTINCAGLYSDRIALLLGSKLSARIVPFRGEYFELKSEREFLCKNLIYPVPNPDFPFLGVHYTRMSHGGIECGPNAVFALAREGYSWSHINVVELAQALSFGGFQRFALKYWREGFHEIWRSLSKAAFVKALQRLIPEIQSEDIVAARAGVRAQALSLDGKLVDDFCIEQSEHAIHVLNAPSPAATSALNIAREITSMVEARWIGELKSPESRARAI